MGVVYFVVLVGVLVFVHELGHFAAAKAFGIKVLRVSLGFGPKVAGFRRGDTEYVVSAIPLGGYVRMLGESPGDGVPMPGDDGRSFADQPLWRRMIVMLAGPVMNLVFPLVLFFVVALGDTDRAPAIVGGAFPDLPADGVLLPDDRILAIDETPISTRDELDRLVEPAADRELELTIERDGVQRTERVTPVLTEERRPLDLVRRVGRLGIYFDQPLAVVGIASSTQPAAAAGLRTFDRVIAAGGRPVDRWIELERILERNRGSMLPVTYLRPQRLIDALSGLGELELYEPHVATLTPEGGPGPGTIRAGIESSDLYVSRVVRGSPEDRAGLRPGDRLVALDGRAIRTWDQFLGELRRSDAAGHELVWKRGEQEITRRVELAHEHGTNELGQTFDRYSVQIEHWAPRVASEPIPHPSPTRYAVSEAFGRTYEMIELTFTSILRLLQGRMSLSSIRGPLTVWEFASEAAREGPLDFLTLMAFLSVNLGLLNLLPIPLLDGGHLLFFGFEGIARRPVSRRVREVASLAGLVVLGLLIALAFTNDIAPKWPRIVAAFESAQ